MFLFFMFFPLLHLPMSLLQRIDLSQQPFFVFLKFVLIRCQQEGTVSILQQRAAKDGLPVDPNVQ